MSVVLAHNTQDFAHQVSSFADAQSFYGNLNMDSNCLASNRILTRTSDNSCSSNSTYESPPDEDAETFSLNSKNGLLSQSSEYVDKCLLDRTKSLILTPSPNSDYESEYNYQKDSKSHSSAAESGVGVIGSPQEMANNSLCTQPADPCEKEVFQKAPYCHEAHESGNIVFVAGLSPEVTVSELVDLFGGREVLKSNSNDEPDVVIHLDRMTGKSRGQATVAFKTSDLAQSAIKRLNFREYHGGRLSVQPYRKKTWSSRRGPGFGYVREYIPCRCWDWHPHPFSDFYEHTYPDNRPSSRNYQGGRHGMGSFRTDLYSRMHCSDPYFEGSYPRSHGGRGDFQFQRYAPDMRISETNSRSFFHYPSRNSRWWNDDERNCFSMGGYGGFPRRQNNSRDYYTRSIYGRGRLVSDNERSNQSWKMGIAPVGDSHKYSDRYSYPTRWGSGTWLTFRTGFVFFYFFYSFR